MIDNLESHVNVLIEKEKEYRNLLQLNQDLRHNRNIITNEINQLQKEGRDISSKVREAKEFPNKIKEVDDKIKELQNKLTEAEKVMARINEAKQKEDAEINSLQSDIDLLKSKLLKLDKTLFE